MLLNRKLIIAVLTLGLILSFSSAAIGYDVTKMKPHETLQSKNLIGAPALQSFRNVPDYQKPADALQLAVNTLDPNYIPYERQCENLSDYGTIYYYWDVPDEYGLTHWATRMGPVTRACTLKSVTVAVAQFEGTPGLTVEIYSDAGGYPDAVIATFDIPNGSLPPVGYYTYLTVEIDAGNAGGATYPDDFIFAEGEDFHVAGSVTGGGEYGVESLKFYSDDGGSESSTRPSGFYPPDTWLLMEDDWGWGYTLLMSSDVCYEEGDLEGDCTLQSFNGPAFYLWDISPYWEYDYSQADAMAVRFTAALPESLHYVDIAFYDAGDDLGDGTGTYPTAEVLLCPVATGGEPDVAGYYHAFTVAPGDQAWYTRIDMMTELGYLPVMTSDFFVVVRILGGGTGYQYISLLSDNENGTVMRSWADYTTEYGVGWATMFDDFEADYNLLIDAYTCHDIYTDCAWDGAYASFSWAWSIPNYMNVDETMWRRGWGTKYNPAFAGCDLGEIYMWFYGGTQAEDAEVGIYDDDGGLPGNKLQYIPITGGSWPSGSFKLATNLFFEQPIWVVIESFAENTADLLIVTDDDNEGPGGRTAILWTDLIADETQWTLMDDLYGYHDNMVAEIYRCCYPFIVRTCAPDGDWPTMGKDFMRTQSTLNEYGDIQCNLTKSWTYINSVASGINFAQPIIAEGYVYAYMFNSLVCVDINTGIQKWRRDANYLEIGGSCRATPSYHDGALYCGGGDNGYFSRFDIETGATVWTYIMYSHAQYAPHIFKDVGGTDVVFVFDGYGNLYGLNTADGSNLYIDPDPLNPLPNAAWTATGQVHKGFTTDGTYLYVGCDEYLTTPNVWRLEVTGLGAGNISVDWNLVDDGPGWQLQNLAAGWANPEASYEGCYSAILYSDEGADGQWIYFIGTFSPQNSSPVHNGGIIYKVSADGTTLGWASECNGGSNGSPGAILNDKAQVIFGGWSQWIEGGEYYGPMAFSKTTGLPQWGPNENSPLWNIQTIPDEWGHVNQPGLLTCETYADPADYDWLVFGNEFGYWNFANPTLGEVVWHRRSALQVTYLAGPVGDEAGHILLADGRKIHCLANDVPRQRLHIADMHPEELVPFGLTDYEEVEFSDLLVNTGCTPLEIFHVELLDEDNGTFPSVRTVNNNRDASISALLAEKTGLTAKLEDAIDERSASRGYTRIKKAPAAFALPDYVITLVEPEDNTIIDPGEAVDIVIAVDGTKIPRGASSFYAEIDSDDPDYFLDSAYMDLTRAGDYARPTVFLTIVGGCLYQSTHIFFGDEQENWLSVWNSTFIHDPSTTRDDGLMIDGENSWLFGCDGLFYSDQMHRVVMHATDGFSNPTWESILPDPLPTCEFGEAHDVVLAQITDDGLSYGNVLGTMLNYAYVDSVEEHWMYEVEEEVTGPCPDPPCTLGVEWEWDIQYETGFNQPYSSELTEGFAFRALVSEYAVTDIVGSKYEFEDFWDFVISRHSLYSRYGTAIPGLFVGIVADWDIDENTANEAMYNEDYSVGWMYETTSPMPQYGGGVVKVPFGPGYTPLINTVDATTAWYGGEEPGFDSIYVWMSRPSTQFMCYDPGITTDKRMWNTIAELNLPPWSFTGDEEDPVPDEAFQTFGYAFFAKFTDHTAADLDNYSGMATLINAFCGFGRGDINNDGETNLTDIVYLACFLHHSGPGPIPFMHMGDVDNDGDVTSTDLVYMIDWYFDGGDAPVGDWALPQFVPAP